MQLRKTITACTVAFAIAALLIAASHGGRKTAKPTQPPVPKETVITYQTVVTKQTLPFSEQRCACAALAPGEEIVAAAGREGLAEQTELVTYEDGKETFRAVTERRTVQQPTPRLVLYGEEHTYTVRTHPAEPTAKDGVLLTPEGDTLSYTRVLSCTATAYSCEGYVGTTAIGTTARVGAVAVDPKYIPYGTKMYIVSDDGAYIYGFATAEDCGNFRGYHVDLYFDTVDECWTFGRRNCTVYILS